MKEEKLIEEFCKEYFGNRLSEDSLDDAAWKKNQSIPNGVNAVLADVLSKYGNAKHWYKAASGTIVVDFDRFHGKSYWVLSDKYQKANGDTDWTAVNEAIKDELVDELGNAGFAYKGKLSTTSTASTTCYLEPNKSLAERDGVDFDADDPETVIDWFDCLYKRWLHYLNDVFLKDNSDATSEDIGNECHYWLKRLYSDGSDYDAAHDYIYSRGLEKDDPDFDPWIWYDDMTVGNPD